MHYLCISIGDRKRFINMAGIGKTNVARLLDRAKIKYELVPYEVDETDLGAGISPTSSAKTFSKCSRHLC